MNTAIMRSVVTVLVTVAAFAMRRNARLPWGARSRRGEALALALVRAGAVA